MTETEKLQQVILRRHGCGSTLARSDSVQEEFEGSVVWRGVVHVFDLIDCARAERCFAWLLHDTDGDERFITVFESRMVNSPAKAVKAAIAAGHLFNR